MSESAQTLEAFRHFREKMNAAILEAGNLNINRFFALDTRTYESGALPVKTKELMVRCREEGVNDAELYDAFAVALVVGGSIVIPHLRRAVARLEELPAP
jgi:alkylhydroperoxidase/carboxymuconolactone decarboxylase family protein YurZ